MSTTTLGCKDIVTRKSEFVAKTQSWFSKKKEYKQQLLIQRNAQCMHCKLTWKKSS